MTDLNKYLVQVKSEEVKYWIEHNLKNHLKTNPEQQGEIEHILDYMQSDKAPPRLKKMSYVQAKSNAQKWVKALKNKGKDVKETARDVKTILKLQDGMRLVQLKTKKAFEREGFLMSHCVASYHNKSGTKVFSLRDADNQPHCTIEVVGDKNLQQIKGKGNGSIHPRYIKHAIQILEHFGLEVRDSEMENLGYLEWNDMEYNFVEENFIGAQYYKVKGKTYFYKYSNLKERGNP